MLQNRAIGNFGPLNRKQRSGESANPGRQSRQSSAGDGSYTTLPKRAGARVWLYRFVAVVLLPALVLGLVELGLRAAGYGYSTAFFKRATLRGRDCLVANDKFGLRFFEPELARSPAPVVIDSTKTPGAIRIFLFGESAALGDPRPAFGMSRYLEVLLQERYPERKIEVVCVAMTAINSHAVLPIARECADLDGNLWVIYMGNNEMVGPFGAATVFGRRVPGLASIRLGLAVKRTRVGQWLDAVARRARRSEGRRGPWAGMEMFVEQQLAPDNHRREIAHAHFAKNLDDVLRVANQAGCPVILCTVASNLRDCAPFASLHSMKCGTETEKTIAGLVLAGGTNQTEGDFDAALAAYGEARALDPGFAEVQFRIGRCELRLGKRIEALRAFETARDCDALPFRASSAVNSRIQSAAARHSGAGVQLLDTEDVLRRQAADGVPGAESFFEHVHLNYAGNYALALALAEKIWPRLPVKVRGSKVQDWASQEICERRLGLTDWNRLGVAANVLARTLAPPFTQQLDHSDQLEFWRNQVRTLQDKLAPEKTAEAREVYREALLSRPHDHYLYENYAEFLEAIGDIEGAISQWEAVRAMLPHSFVAYVHAGRLMVRQQRFSAAEERLRKALELEPRSPEGHLEFGRVLAGLGHLDRAIAEYNEALRWKPGNAIVYFHLADALAKDGRRPAATEALFKAVELQPSYWEARYLLGVELAMSNRLAEAQQQFEETIRWRPNHALAHLNLGVAYARQGRMDQARMEFQEALRLDPGSQKAKQGLETIESLTRRQGPVQ